MKERILSRTKSPRYLRDNSTTLLQKVSGCILFCLVSVVSSICSMFRSGGIVNGPILLTISLLSTVALLAFYCVVPGYHIRGRGRRQLAPLLATIAIYVPVGWALLLFFYKGIWSLWLLTNGFRFRSMVLALFWLAVGYRTSRWLSEMIQIVDGVEDGYLSVVPDSEHSE